MTGGEFSNDYAPEPVPEPAPEPVQEPAPEPAPVEVPLAEVASPEPVVPEISGADANLVSENLNEQAGLMSDRVSEQASAKLTDEMAQALRNHGVDAPAEPFQAGEVGDTAEQAGAALANARERAGEQVANLLAADEQTRAETAGMEADDFARREADEIQTDARRADELASEQEERRRLMEDVDTLAELNEKSEKQEAAFAEIMQGFGRPETVESVEHHAPEPASPQLPAEGQLDPLVATGLFAGGVLQKFGRKK